jgi:3-keto-5-aminohexanoate cleavage enzyme
MTTAVVIEAALNGGRNRAENPAVPYTAKELAAEARRCADAGATVFHVHARGHDGGWTADAARYAEVVRELRQAVPEGLISITSLRPEGAPVEVLLEQLEALSADPETTPDLISINLGHIVAWEPLAGGKGRRTVHFPNAYDDITRLLVTCAKHGIQPELGIMDLGFVSNAVALRDDGALPANPWFLLELDSPVYGSGNQVAPATIANYDALAAALRENFPAARWAAHGQGIAGYAVIERALASGAHIRVGFEDAIHLPDGSLAGSNADLVAWAVSAAGRAGREPASFAEGRAIIGAGSHPSPLPRRERGS